MQFSGVQVPDSEQAPDTFEEEVPFGKNRDDDKLEEDSKESSFSISNDVDESSMNTETEENDSDTIEDSVDNSEKDEKEGTEKVKTD